MNILFKSKGILQYILNIEFTMDLAKKLYKNNVKNVGSCQYENYKKIINFEVHHINFLGQIYKCKDLLEFEKYLIKYTCKTNMLCKKHFNMFPKNGVFKKNLNLDY